MVRRRWRRGPGVLPPPAVRGLLLLVAATIAACALLLSPLLAAGATSNSPDPAADYLTTSEGSGQVGGWMGPAGSLRSLLLFLGAATTRRGPSHSPCGPGPSGLGVWQVTLAAGGSWRLTSVSLLFSECVCLVLGGGGQPKKPLT